MTEKTFAQQFSEKMAQLGKNGGAVRAQRLSKAQRSRSARKAAKARWLKSKGTK